MRISALELLAEKVTVFIQKKGEERLAGLLISRRALIKTTHSQLVNELGSVREVFSRILKNFEIMGRVKRNRNQVQGLYEKAFIDIARLR